MTTPEYIEKLREALEGLSKVRRTDTEQGYCYGCFNSLNCSPCCPFVLLETAMALPIPDDRPKPWPPPEDVREVLAFDKLTQRWKKEHHVSVIGWQHSAWSQFFSHWLPMPPAPGGGK